MNAPVPSLALLEARGLTVHVPDGRWRAPPRVLLQDVNLRVGRGETLAVVGESGAGKSTLVRALLRLLPPAAGQVLIGGQDLAILSPVELRAQRRRIQLVFQDPLASLNPALTVLELVADPLRPGLRAALDAGMRDRVVEQLAAVGMDARFLQRRCSELSGGQAQRVAIARALITEPEMLICDEPVSALDLALRAQVLELLAGLCRSRSLGMLMVTHDLHAARLMCARMLVLRRGAVVEEGASAELFAQPRSDYTRELLAAMLSVDPAARPGSESVS
ncbi:MAG TPA: ABC transporter ATP-binding protein [Steroidobacteraceae bacterium]|nr:ABC transporter ATP-binding protein [Steroidobacteraceae bacterium]